MLTLFWVFVFVGCRSLAQLRVRDTNEEVTTESGIYKYLCSKYITLATMYPTSNPEQGFVDKVHGVGLSLWVLCVSLWLWRLMC